MTGTSIAIFASGSGTNALKLIEYFNDESSAQIALVISNRKKAGVLQIAQSHKIPTLVIDREYFYHSQALLKELGDRQIDFIILAGFLWLIPEYLLKAYPKKIVNIHPALLPKYGGKGMYGMNVHQAVWAAGEKESGITIHYVNERYDEGDIIFQAACQLSPDDNPDSIRNKVQALEHRYFPSVVLKLIQNKEINSLYP
jgi:phosphoribosylglycinamide formyltransferase-1